MIKYLFTCYFEDKNGNISNRDYWFDDLDKAIDGLKNTRSYQWSLKNVFTNDKKEN